MSLSIRVAAAILSIFATVTAASAQQATWSLAAPEARQVAFELGAERGGDGALVLNWLIAPGHYLYRDSLRATADGVPLDLVLPPGEMKDDPSFGRIEIYHDAVAATVAVPAAGHLEVRYQGCSERGVCLPPETRTIDLATLAVGEPRLAVPTSGGAAAEFILGEDPVSAQLFGAGIGWTLVVFLGFGVLLSLTPCVLPMLPILSGLLAQSGERLTTGRSIVLAGAYALAMAAAYGVLGLVAGWSGANLQVALQSPWVLGLSAMVFVALALAMFGLYALSLPAGLARRLQPAGGRAGSVTGAAMLGFGSALVVGPCVTPPLAAALIYAASTGEAWRGAAALFALGLGMGLPLLLLGAFGPRVLPRAGPWLVRVRQGFGFVFLGLAIVLAARVVPGSLALLLWGGLAIAVAAFLGVFDGPPVGTAGRISRGAGFAAAVYGAALIFGAAAGGSDPLRPLAVAAPAAGDAREGVFATRVTSPEALEATLARDVTGSQRAAVVFTAEWCTVCRANEAVFHAPGIGDRLADLPTIAVDVTAYDDGTRRLMQRYAVAGPPTFVILDRAGRELPGSRIVGAVSEAELARRLADAGI